MLAVLSPAKSLDYESPLTTSRFSEPALMHESALLIEQLRQFAPADIASLMHLSDKLAGLNVARYAQWEPVATPQNARPAVLAFNGDVYSGLAAQDFDDADLDVAQQHIRILSGLYGLLRPLDLLQPYRLEMGTKLGNPRGKDLYAFWGDIITGHLNQALTEQGDNVLLNLASDEYFKSVNVKRLAGRVITPVFQDEKNGKYKIISFYAKKARGLMARYLVKERISKPEQLLDFTVAGYGYCPELSTENKLVFRRPEDLSQ
ncbi:protein of unknown function DUF328 [Tolumonas auensis DSM 9187]|uniref:UPF0246 protein Tola_0968 n=1 Tax=Tolumonas auensis (strain DSM 9187 / NBRC 110442 / TA 4) TaxID=595494 RepID=Y968_TOLAT|nr:peroxide stress protein YaaA [Tolumonas auensis]C4LCN2.1 RecName: Full=UPF0246 protein Tola_0968 [Tolumonas auensis DSM 9187]ACQ92596.1 protein of unknown function DUF328 [Tolumonas auensis DSM 9187]